MKILKFKCTLLSDIIINQNASTEGNQESLDFIPGNNFLGIVAGNLYNTLDPKDALMLFHNGRVRYSDAHPLLNNTRSLRIPASMHYPKMSNVYKKCYIHNKIPDFKKLKSEQLKQCRSDFYAFDNYIGLHAEVHKRFVIKSEYDREKRRSKDELMFGYQSINEGTEFCFSIEIDDIASKFADSIKDALIGKKHIGRSKTAQYGLVNIEEYDFKEVNSNDGNNEITIYADSRLIFLDETTQATFQPTAEQLLAVKGGDIIWAKSQIRTFQYSPWNFIRQSRDTDRCGIEKGSVFVVDISKCEKSIKFNSCYVGSYNNEGFGKIIYNPDFLQSDNNGEALYKLIETDNSKETIKIELSGDSLLDYLSLQKSREEINNQAYLIVNKFIEQYALRFKDDLFASQWGVIRSIAMRNKTKESLKDEIFTKYLSHGIAAEKWNKNKRFKIFEQFFNELNDNNAQIILINLASVMAKECKSI